MDERTISLTIGVNDDGTPVIKIFAANAEQAFQKIEKRSESLVESVKKHWLGLTAAAYGAAQTISKAWALAEDAAKFQQQAQGFANLTASHGVNSKKIISDLKAMSGETMSTAAIMQSAGNAIVLGIPAERLSKMMEIARASSRITGQSVQKSFEDIARGVGRQSKMILDNLGIMINVDTANEDYAASLGKTAEQLSDIEKKQAFLNATMTAGEDIIRRVGVQDATTAEKMEKFNVKMAELRLAVGQGLIQVFMGLTAAFQWVAAGALSGYQGIAKLMEGISWLQSKIGLTKALREEGKKAAEDWKEIAKIAGEAAQDLTGKAAKDWELAMTSGDVVGAAGKKVQPLTGGGGGQTAAKKAEEERKKYQEDLNKKLAADNDYHLKKWQAETEWAAKQREINGQTIAKSLADTNKALEEEISLQLYLIDLKEKEGQISPFEAIDQRITYEEELLKIQEEALSIAQAYTLEWYAAQNAIAKTRGTLVELSKSKIKVATETISSPEALLAKAGTVGQIVLLVKAVADFPKMLSAFIKAFMQALFDFPKYFIELFDNVIARLPLMLGAIITNFFRQLPRMLESLIYGIVSMLIGLMSLGFVKIIKNGDTSSGLDENTKAVNQLADSIDSLNDSINDTLKDMLTSSDSPLSAIERLQVAWDDVASLKQQFAGASGEAKVALGAELKDALGTYLDVAQEAYQRPSTEYQAIFDATIGELKAIQSGLAGIGTSMGGSSYSVQFNTEWLAEIFSDAWEGLKKIFSDAWESLKNVFAELPEKIWDGIKKIMDLPEKIWEKLKELPKLIPKEIKGLFEFNTGDYDPFNTGWKLHKGGMIHRAHSGMFLGDTLASYEVPIIAKVGEGVLNDYNGMKAIGGEAGLNYANKTGRFPFGGGSDNRTYSYSVSPQITINTKGEIDTESLVRKIIRATEDSLKYGKMRQIVNS